jgi:hypothetical protein
VTSSQVPVPVPRGGRWPGRPMLTSRLREILRKEHRVQDAWIVHAHDGWRLEIRRGGRVTVLHRGDDVDFWTPFYSAAVRNAYVRGQLVLVLAPTQRRRAELAALLRAWCDAGTSGPGPSN